MFETCMVDIEGKDVVKKFKSLHKELNIPFRLQKISDTSLVKYIVATYDMNSPFVERYGDLSQRRRETAKYSELPREGDYYIEEAEQIVLGYNEVVNGIIVRYLFCQHDTTFIQLQAYQSMYFKQIKASISADFNKPSDWDKLKANIDVLTEEIQKLQKAVFSGEELPNMRRALYEFVDKITTDFRPEDRAEKLQNNEPVVDVNPYGDYMPDDLKFVDDE